MRLALRKGGFVGGEDVWGAKVLGARKAALDSSINQVAVGEICV